MNGDSCFFVLWRVERIKAFERLDEGFLKNEKWIDWSSMYGVSGWEGPL